MQGKHVADSHQVQPIAGLDSEQPAVSSARTILTLDTAMSLYGLTESESFWETKQDTRCLVSWGNGHVVVAF